MKARFVYYWALVLAHAMTPLDGDAANGFKT